MTPALLQEIIEYFDARRMFRYADELRTLLPATQEVPRTSSAMALNDPAKDYHLGGDHTGPHARR